MSEVSSFPQFVEYQGVPMLNANEVARFLGYKKTEDGRKKCNNLIRVPYKESEYLGLPVGANMHGVPLIPSNDACVMVSLCRNDLTQIDVSGFLRHINLVNDNSYVTVTNRAEYIAIRTIEQLLRVKLHKQYPCGKYKIDAYDKLNKVAYEIDESKHRYQQEADAERQAYIEGQLGCTFVRIKL